MKDPLIVLSACFGSAGFTFVFGLAGQLPARPPKILLMF